MKVYVKGLELVYPGKQTGELMKMVEQHPAFQRPDTLPRPNPQVAEQHFGRGLEAYWGCRYAEAEEEFKQAVSFFDQDARYQYFLGLARYQQAGKTKRE